MSAERLRLPSGVVRGRITPPPSKSLTQRYLNLALLAGQGLDLTAPSDSQDAVQFRSALETIGWRVTVNPEHSWSLEPGGHPSAGAAIDCGASGTMLRFLTASLAVIPGHWCLSGVVRLGERPIVPLVDALRQLGAEIQVGEGTSTLPLTVRGGTLRGGRCTLDATQSSQFVSALLMAAGAAPEPVTLTLSGLTSAPYLDLTLEAMARFGVTPERESASRFRLSPGGYRSHDVQVEPDASAACYFAAAAALTGGQIDLLGLRRDSTQGDVRFLALLRRMGAQVQWRDEGVRVRGTGILRGVDVDLSAMPDQLPTLAALAPFCTGTTRIRGVAHVRLKESDRLAAMTRELRRLGAVVDQSSAGLTVQGIWVRDEPPSAEVCAESWGDHRIAMSLALVALRRRGVELDNARVVEKSYPDFWRHLAAVVR